VIDQALRIHYSILKQIEPTNNDLLKENIKKIEKKREELAVELQTKLEILKKEETSAKAAFDEKIRKINQIQDIDERRRQYVEAVYGS